jgi:hypothetical protein
LSELYQLAKKHLKATAQFNERRFCLAGWLLSLLQEGYGCSLDPNFMKSPTFINKIMTIISYKSEAIKRNVQLSCLICSVVPFANMLLL